jgi:hypothetical protein
MLLVNRLVTNPSFGQAGRLYIHDNGIDNVILTFILPGFVMIVQAPSKHERASIRFPVMMPCCVVFPHRIQAGPNNWHSHNQCHAKVFSCAIGSPCAVKIHRMQYPLCNSTGSARYRCDTGMSFYEICLSRSLFAICAVNFPVAHDHGSLRWGFSKVVPSLNR